MPGIETCLVKVANLRIGYQNRRGYGVDILRGVTLTISPGETLGLVGESGSGKSTLALALLGYFRRVRFSVLTCASLAPSPC